MRQLAKKLKKLLTDEIIDIVIIGSSVKGKIGPSDCDIILISDKDVSETRQEIRKIINNADIQKVGLNDYAKQIWLTIIREGYSVRHGKPLRELYGIKPAVLYKYSLKELTNSKKVMFERAIKDFDAEKLSNRVVLVPIGQSSEFEQFLRHWGLDIDAQEYHLMPLLRKEEL